MGQEIVYCAKCQRMLRGSDFEKGAAFRVDSQAYCRACAPTLTPDPVPPPSRPPGTATPKRGTSRIPLAAPPSKPTQRHAAGPRRTNPLVWIGVAAGILLLLVHIAVAASGGRPAPAPRASAEPARPPSPPPKAAENAPVRVASERPPAQPVPPALKPAPAAEKSFAEQLAELDREIRVYVEKKEFPNAQMVLEAARKRHSEPSWAAEIDRRIGEVEKARPKEAAKPPPPPPPPKPDPEPPKPLPAPTARATFVAIDAATQGNWRGAYGTDGFELAQGVSRPPAYGQVSVAGQSPWTWAAATAEPRGLQKPEGADRLAACWWSEGSFTIDVSLAGEETRRVAFYCLDWDGSERSQTLEVLDAATGAVLDTRSLSAYAQGKYVVWDLKGRVRIKATRTGKVNAVVSGIFFGAAPPPAAEAANVPDPSLVLWLALDEGKGTSAADGSGQGNPGLVRGGAAWAEGKSGKAIRLDGRDDHVKVADSPSLNAPADQITIAAWVYRSVDQAGHRLVVARQRGAGREDQYVFGFRDNVYVFGLQAADGDRSVEGPVAPTAQWVHMAGTYDGTTVRLYVNGAEAKARPYPAAAKLVQEPKPVIVGAAQNRASEEVQEAFTGLVDDVRIYSRALTAADVAALAAGKSNAPASAPAGAPAGKPSGAKPAVSDDGLVGHWTFDQVDGTTVRDHSRHANHGTLLSSPAPVEGRLAGALAFDAERRQGVRVADSPSLSVAGPFTAAAWIKFTHRDRVQVAIVEKWDTAAAGAANGFMLRVSPDGKAKLVICDAAGLDGAQGRTPLPAETWTHVAAVYDGKSVHIYVNGKLEESDAIARAPADGAAPLTIAHTPSGGNRFTGAIDDVRLYSRALSEAEVAALAAASPVPQAGLALWLRGDAGVQLEEDLVARWEDQSGNGRHAESPAGGRPAFMKDAASGQSGLHFDGKNDHLTFTLPVNGLSGMTIFLASACTQDRDGGAKSKAENAALYWEETSPWGTVYVNPFQSRVQWRFGTTQRDNWPTFVRPASIGAEATITTARKDGATDSLWVDGQPVMSQTGKLARIAGCKDAASIGRGPDGRTFFAGGIAEILVYTRALPDDERQAVEQYLRAKYRK